MNKPRRACYQATVDGDRRKVRENQPPEPVGGYFFDDFSLFVDFCRFVGQIALLLGNDYQDRGRFPFGVRPNLMSERIRLLVENGLDPGRSEICQPASQLVVGRGSDSDLSLVDMRMSREHFAIRHDGSAWTVEDLDSQHGTKLNEVPIASTQRLEHGDLLVAGDTLFRVIVEQRRFFRFHAKGPVEPIDQLARGQHGALNNRDRE